MFNVKISIEIFFILRKKMTTRLRSRTNQHWKFVEACYIIVLILIAKMVYNLFHWRGVQINYYFILERIYIYVYLIARTELLNYSHKM